MPKASSAPQLASRILNSKGGSASSAAATRRPHPSRNSNFKSAQQRHQSSPILTSRGQRSELRALKATASGGLDSDGLEEDDFLEPAKMRKTTRASTKITTAKEKRQATLAAAERNAARLTVESENQVPSEDDHSQDEGDNPHAFKALSFGDASADDDEDDEEDPPEAAHRPRLTRSQSIEYDEDDEHDGAVGLENDDSDEDDPANSPTRQIARKAKSAGVMFTAPTTTSLSSKLPAKKVHRKTKTNKPGSNTLPEATRSPARAGTVASSPSTPGSSAASPPKTPRSKASANTNRHRLYDQTPSTQGLLKASSSDTRQDLLVEDAFPERTIFTEKCKAIFLAACVDVQATLHRQRFLKSNTYRGVVLYILRQKLSQVRQEVRNAALAKTAIHYGINSSMEPGDIVSHIDRLKTKIAYVFGDVDQYKRPYGNPLIQTLINVLFFEGKRKSDALANPVPWNPMPLPIIALVATAIHSVLDDWSSGKNEAAKSKFSHDKYAPIYRDHLANLDKFKQRAPAALSKLQTSLWENAWLSTGSALPDQANVYIEDDVFAEAEAEALA